MSKKKFNKEKVIEQGRIEAENARTEFEDMKNNSAAAEEMISDGSPPPIEEMTAGFVIPTGVSYTLPIEVNEPELITHDGANRWKTAADAYEASPLTNPFDNYPVDTGDFLAAQMKAEKEAYLNKLLDKAKKEADARVVAAASVVVEPIAEEVIAPEDEGKVVVYLPEPHTLVTAKARPDEPVKNNGASFGQENKAATVKGTRGRHIHQARPGAEGKNV